MIKINLATRKTSAAMGGEGGGAGLQGFIDGLGGGGGVEALKSLPIKRFAVAIVLGYGVSYGLDYYKTNELQKLDDLLSKINADQAKLKGDLEKTKGYEEIKKSLDADESTIRTKIDIIMKLLSGRQTASKMLTGLANALPPEVWISAFTVNESEIGIRGSAIGYNQISDFMKSIGENAFFGELKLVGADGAKDETGDMTNFTISAKRREGSK